MDEDNENSESSGDAGLPWWARIDFWRKTAIFVTAFMALVLIGLTFHTLNLTYAGSERVPAYSVINHRISYEHSDERGFQVPVIGDEIPMFGKVLSEDEAYELVTLGKITTQAKNCVNCHTMLGNGAYYAPDLTKSWLDPQWVNEDFRETLMFNFLMDPPANRRAFGTGRIMPRLGLTENETRGVMAYLKWMAAIDTNGFPAHFKSLPQGENTGEQPRRERERRRDRGSDASPAQGEDAGDQPTGTGE